MSSSIPSPPSKSLQKTIYAGTFIHTPSLGTLTVLEDAAVGVDEHGVIRYLESDIGTHEKGYRLAVENVLQRWLGEGWDGVGMEWVMGSGGKGGGEGQGWWFPGFIDTHIHAPQYPNTGLFGTTTLLSWLEKYTFPLESSFSSLAKARHVYTRVISRTLAHGTTTASYYATLHVPATNLLSSLCLAMGQRAKVGRVCMDSTLNPSFYRDENANAALSATQATITHCEHIDPKRELVEPIITPRFAPSCTADALAGLGALAKKHDLPIQTHISENKAEIELVSTLFPEHGSYTDVYAAHDLLTPRTVLGHAIHLSEEERELVRAKGAGVSHCPISNSYLSSGLCPVRELLDAGVKVGLGTDVSGGWSPSVLAAAREALGVSRVLASVEGGHEKETRQKDIERLKLSVEEVLYLATMGGARCLGLENKVGTFEVGKKWDAQMIVGGDFSGGSDTEKEEPEEGVSANQVPTGDAKAINDNPIELWGKESWSEKLAKWVFCGDDRNVKKVWVKGRLVHQRS